MSLLMTMMMMMMIIQSCKMLKFDDGDDDGEDFHLECVRVIRRGVKLMVGTFVPLYGGVEKGMDDSIGSQG